jgi:ribosomal protein L11 methyltransferase
MARQQRPASRPLWQVSVTAGSAAETALIELVKAAGLTTVSSFTDFIRGTATVSFYAEKLPAPREGLRADLLARLARLKKNGTVAGKAVIRFRRLSYASWAEAWKNHFPPLNIRNRLLIVPPWNRQRPRGGQCRVVLEPGLSFGTGHHPTTLFSLRQLVRLRIPQTRQSMLDAGTGSGLLAIAAAKLGYAPVHAFDLDPVAVKTARENARANGVADRVEIGHADLKSRGARPRHGFDVICANLTADLLIGARDALLKRLNPGGTLVLAGILSSELASVIQRYERQGEWHIRQATSAGWSSCTLRRLTMR